MNFKKFLVVLILVVFVIPASVIAQNVTVSENVSIYLPAIGQYFTLLSSSNALDQLQINSAGTSFTIITNLSTGTVVITSSIGVDMGGTLNDNNIALTSCDISGSRLTIQANTSAARTVIVTPTGTICTSATPTPSSGSGGAGAGGGGGGVVTTTTTTGSTTGTTTPAEGEGEGEGEPTSGVEEFDCNSLNDIAVINRHWAKDFIFGVCERGIMTGREQADGSRTFASNSNMVRAEFSKVAVTSLGELPLLSSLSPFPDVADSSLWYFVWVNKAKDLDLVSGDSAGNFNPARNITRAESAVILGKMVINDLDEELPDGTEILSNDLTFPDVESSHFAYAHIALVKKFGLMKGNVEGPFAGMFRPSDPITRAEISAIIMRFLGL